MRSSSKGVSQNAVFKMPSRGSNGRFLPTSSSHIQASSKGIVAKASKPTASINSGNSLTQPLLRSQSCSMPQKENPPLPQALSEDAEHRSAAKVPYYPCGSIGGRMI